ncbi:hypothetical protein GGX14DRAFT_571205 [Mycena pura]|uniref:Uncharacterized protein n=1 Tax=Mycena pura TaxID=153505 RepID=A0AAD6V6Z3_9AGAR|nr:hypothetical protein GGX14DRAFT_571205 [Mycena pura]
MGRADSGGVPSVAAVGSGDVNAPAVEASGPTPSGEHEATAVEDSGPRPPSLGPPSPRIEVPTSQPTPAVRHPAQRVIKPLPTGPRALRQSNPVPLIPPPADAVPAGPSVLSSGRASGTAVITASSSSPPDLLSRLSAFSSVRTHETAVMSASSPSPPALLSRLRDPRPLLGRLSSPGPPDPPPQSLLARIASVGGRSPDTREQAPIGAPSRTVKRKSAKRRERDVARAICRQNALSQAAEPEVDAPMDTDSVALPLSQPRDDRDEDMVSLGGDYDKLWVLGLWHISSQVRTPSSGHLRPDDSQRGPIGRSTPPEVSLDPSARLTIYTFSFTNLSDPRLPEKKKKHNPKVIFLVGKAASAYYIAKLTPRLTVNDARMIKVDPDTKDLLSLSSCLTTPSQGTVASGTSNMKFCRNGELLGTVVFFGHLTLTIEDLRYQYHARHPDREGSALTSQTCSTTSLGDLLSDECVIEKCPDLANVLNHVSGGAFGDIDMYEPSRCSI